MSKAFIKETDTEEEDSGTEEQLPTGFKNYITVYGFKRLKDELHDLLVVKRPELTAVIAWAASNGDRSENADYIYGKRRLREIDRRIRFLTKRIESAETVDPATNKSDQVFFGATVTLIFEDEEKPRKYSIVGVDEIDIPKNRISWISPLAKSLMKKRKGDLVNFQSPKGLREVEILEVSYVTLD